MTRVDRGARPKKRILGVALRVGLTCATFAYLFTRIPFRELEASLGRIPGIGLAGSCQVWAVCWLRDAPRASGKRTRILSVHVALARAPSALKRHGTAAQAA